MSEPRVLPKHLHKASNAEVRRWDRVQDELDKVKGGMFVRVPSWWVWKLAEAKNIATYKVALHLLRRVHVTGLTGIRVANRIEGVNREAKRTALRELEHLGLVKISRPGGSKSPQVKLLRLCRKAN